MRCRGTRESWIEERVNTPGKVREWWVMGQMTGDGPGDGTENEGEEPSGKSLGAEISGQREELV